MADYILSVTGAELENRLIRPLPVNQGGTGQIITRQTPEVTFDASVASAHSIHVRLYPYLGMCFVRGQITIADHDVEPNQFFTVATVDSTTAPQNTTALSVSAPNGALAVINSSGEIRVALETALSASTTRYIYLSGWWIVAQN